MSRRQLYGVGLAFGVLGLLLFVVSIPHVHVAHPVTRGSSGVVSGTSLASGTAGGVLISQLPKVSGTWFEIFEGTVVIGMIVGLFALIVHHLIRRRLRLAIGFAVALLLFLGAVFLGRLLPAQQSQKPTASTSQVLACSTGGSSVYLDSTSSCILTSRPGAHWHVVDRLPKPHGSRPGVTGLTVTPCATPTCSETEPLVAASVSLLRGPVVLVNQNAPALLLAPAVSQVAAAPPAPPHPSSLLDRLLGDLVVALGAIALLTVVIGAAVLLRRRRTFGEGASPVADEESPGDLEAVLGAASSLIEDEPDPRTAILKCWVRIESVAEEHGIDHPSSATAGELFARLLPASVSVGDSLSELFRLFSRARYSSAQLTEADRQAALTALAALRRAAEEGRVGLAAAAL